MLFTAASLVPVTGLACSKHSISYVVVVTSQLQPVVTSLHFLKYKRKRLKIISEVSLHSS